MNIKPIRNDEDLKLTFQRLESIFQAEEGSPEAEEMEVLVALVFVMLTVGGIVIAAIKFL